MNTITRTAIAAAPLAIAALTLAPGAAMAETPVYNPELDLVYPTPGPIDPGPTDPGPASEPPSASDDLTAVPPCPTHGDCTPGDDDEPGDDDYDVPTRIDAGIASQGENDTVLSWTLAGGAIVLASGAAFGAARQRRTA